MPLFQTIKRQWASLILSIKPHVRLQELFPIVTILLIVIAIRFPIDYIRIMTDTDNDFGAHIYFALDMLHGRPVPAFTSAHSLWQMLLIGIWTVSRSRIDFWQSAIALQSVSSIASTLILYFWYKNLPSKPSTLKCLFWAVTLVIITPVIALNIIDSNYYFGYIGLANYHNPTIHMLRPFALIMFMIALGVLSDRPLSSNWLVFFSAVVTAAATFLKPSYTIALLPALGVFVLYRFAKKQSINWKLLIFGLGIPAVLCLAPQFIITYISGEPHDGIAFIPFAAASVMAGFHPAKYILSAFFPLVMLAANFNSMKRSPEVLLAWLAFAAGLMQFFLFAETGSRFEHGNFLWGAQISLFVLFAVTIRHLLKEKTTVKSLLRPAGWAPYLVYLPHIISGIAYYLYCLNNSRYS
jgi:hypothetical protein